MGNKKKETLAYLGLTASTLIIGLSFIFVKVALRFSNAIDFLAYRFIVALIVIAILHFLRVIKIPKIPLRKLSPILLLSLFYPLLFFGLQTFGLEQSTASEGGIIFATTPIITLLAASFFLKEKTTFVQKVSIFLSVFGVLYILYKKGLVIDSGNLIGIILLLLSVLSVVAYYIFGKKIISNYSVIEITIVMSILASIVFTAVAIVFHLSQGNFSLFIEPLYQMNFIWSILYLSILSTLFTSFFTNFAVTIIPASAIGVFNNLSPIISVIGGVIFLDETLYGYHIIGGVLILLGVIGTVTLKK